MKKIIALCLCGLLVFAAIPYSQASGLEEMIYVQEAILDNGIRVVDFVSVIPQTRSSTETFVRGKNFYDGENLAGYIRFEATFRYDGTSVSVVSKTVTNTDTYNGWSYTQNSFTSSGGTVTLSGKLTKWLILQNPFTMTLTCDANGNISYT